MKTENYKLKLFSKVNATLLFALLLLSFLACTEEIDLKTETFESALVVQANLTNENALQKIVLSRTFAFEDNGPPPETNASVTVTDDLNTIYQFQETGIPGTYFSTSAFAAVIGRQYTLDIITTNGRTYKSLAVTLNPGIEIGQIYAERNTNAQNSDGVSIFLDSYDAANNSKYYRFEYEETYKIVSPFSSTQTFNLDENNRITLVDKLEEEKTCYNTVTSTNISLANTSVFGEDRLTRFPIRFLETTNPRIGFRYSILVRQFVISREAYTFYEMLRNFSGSESLFSQVQPGFISGNIQSTQNNNEKVIGFFDVATVSERRLFFNFQDIFQDGPEPQYFARGCEQFRPSLGSLPNLISSDDVRFYFLPAADDPPELGEGPYYVLSRPCIDCRSFGTNEVPEFWEE